MSQVPEISLRQLIEEYELAREYSSSLVDGLSQAQFSWRPNSDASGIGWHYGHQAAVNHFMVRNLTAAEPSVNPEFDALFDSARPEPSRDPLPSIGETAEFRVAVGHSTVATLERIMTGDVGAPAQLAIIADGLLRAVINHEYQHATWMREVRETFAIGASPEPKSARLDVVDGYWLLGR